MRLGRTRRAQSNATLIEQDLSHYSRIGILLLATHRNDGSTTCVRKVVSNVVGDGSHCPVNDRPAGSLIPSTGLA